MERSPAPAAVAQATTPVRASASPLPAPPPSAQRDATVFIGDYELGAQYRTPTRLALGSPMPGSALQSALRPHLQPSPAGFNPDDYFASPPCRGRATPECKRRLFLDDPTTPLRNSTPANGPFTGTTTGATTGSTPNAALLFSYGSLETPRAGQNNTPGINTPSGAPSGRKRARPDSTFSLSNYLSPSRNLFTNNSILCPTPPPPPAPPKLAGTAPSRQSIPVSAPASVPLSTPVTVSAPIQAQAQTTALRADGNSDNEQHNTIAITTAPSTSLAATSTAPALSAIPGSNCAAIVSTVASASTHTQSHQVQAHALSTLVTAVAPPRPAKRRLFETPGCIEVPACSQPGFAGNSTDGSCAKTRSVVFTTTPITPNDGNARQLKCSCKASKCLKLYCPCFAASSLCGDGCSCQNCQNTTSCAREIDEARANCLQRDPKAFLRGVRAAAELGGHSKGCNCRKGCSKNYCVCRELGVTCGPRCTCSGPNGCQNGKSEEFPVVRSIQSMRNKKSLSLPTSNPPNSTTSVPMPLTIPQPPIQSQNPPRASTQTLVQPTMHSQVQVSLPQASPPTLPSHSQQGLNHPSSAPAPASVVPPMAPEPPLLPNTQRIEDAELDEDEHEFFRQLHAAAEHANSPPDEPLFPPTTPDRVKKDLLALASTPTTQPTKDRFASRRNNSIAQPISRPPRILRLKMGCGKPIRPFPIQ